MVKLTCSFFFSVKDDLTSDKMTVVIGTGFQHVIDSYFWYMPFCSPRQCKHVLDVVAKIPEKEWMDKREEIQAEHNQAGAWEELKQGLDCKRFPQAVPHEK